jgi:hypothetical protein
LCDLTFYENATVAERRSRGCAGTRDAFLTGCVLPLAECEEPWRDLRRCGGTAGALGLSHASSATAPAPPPLLNHAPAGAATVRLAKLESAERGLE